MKVLPAALAVGLAAPPALDEGDTPLSKAARWLMQEQAEAGCPGRGGRFEGGVFEQDLTGDGKRDLVLSHEGLSCHGGRAMSDFAARRPVRFCFTSAKAGC